MTRFSSRCGRAVRRRAAAAGMLALVLLLGVRFATARDLDGLAKLVVPAYTAMNFAMICVREDPSFPVRMAGTRGTVLHYAQHVKDEVIANLTDEEARAVLQAAAGAAQTIARNQLRRLAKEADVIYPLDIAAWCTGPAAEFIRHFVESHDQGHAAFEALLEEALR